MLFLKYLLLVGGFGLLATAAGFVIYDIYLAFELDRLLHRGQAASPENPTVARPAATRKIRLTPALKLAGAGALAILLGLSILVVPDGEAGVRISQISGVRPGTLYAGTHLIAPLIDRVALFEVRDQVFATSASESVKTPAAETKELPREVLQVQAREGLTLGLGVVVRYRIDPSRLAFIQANLPQPIDQEIVSPVVTTVFREVAPNYVVRDAFATKREEFRARAAELITKRLAEDGIVVKEVLLRQVQIPEEYAKGLQDLLLKEQESEQMNFETEIEEKRVKIAEYRADAAKVSEIKHAEGDAQSRVIQAKAEADSMQYTLPLKQKQIEQAKLEAQARKETTIENAQAAAEAKVIDSKAEQERRNLLAEAEANHIRLTSAAEAQQMQLEGAALKTNPMLIQKIIAERLSDKVQIMMVPTDGKFFFTNDVFRSAQGSVDDPSQKVSAQP
ncbi:MAG: SPFH domain-containing protein [Candidatus Acidiferrales bacterium]